MKELNYSKNYKYAHDHPNNFAHTEFLPDALSGQQFYTPGKNKREDTIKSFLKNRWNTKYNY